MSVYESLGVRRVINADARLTALGGSLMPESVLRAMNVAAGSYVDMHDLQRRVGARLASLTRNEAAYVATGAAAGLVLATLACMTRGDLRAIARLPNLDGLPDEVVVHTAHRIPYDPAVALGGARLVQVGDVLQTFPWQLEASLGSRTAAVLYVAGKHLQRGALPLEETVHVAHACGVPVVVDAAAQLPPPSNLWHYTVDAGADLAVFSGGKDLRGPQASGLILGRPDLVEACAANGAPHQRLARAMKVGKEEMLGLLAAVERYLDQDHERRIARFERVVRWWVETFAAFDGVWARRDFPNEAGQPTPRALVEVEPSVVGVTAEQIRDTLWAGDPPIAVASAEKSGILLTPDTLCDGEERIVTDRLCNILSRNVGPYCRPGSAP